MLTVGHLDMPTCGQMDTYVPTLACLGLEKVLLLFVLSRGWLAEVLPTIIAAARPSLPHTHLYTSRHPGKLTYR